MKTTPTMTATVTVTLIAASLSPAMRLANAWNLPWRFLKSAIVNRKTIDNNPENCREGIGQSTRRLFLGKKKKITGMFSSWTMPSCCFHPGGLYICNILVL